MDCFCVTPFKNLSGMPVLITLIIESEEDKDIPETFVDHSEPNKVISDNGINATANEADQDLNMKAKNTKMNNKVEKTLQTPFDNIKAETFLTYILITGKMRYRYFLYLMIVRSAPDHGTKETMLPMVQYLDSSKRLTFRSEKTKYLVKFTTRISIRHDVSKKSYEQRIKVKDMDSALKDFELVYWNIGFMKTYLGHGYYQILSTLMYCKQVELVPSEFTEREGIILVNHTDYVYSASDFFRVSPTRVRICIENYLDYSTGVTIRNRNMMFSFAMLCYVVSFIQ